jgi:hypothetical protein
MIFICHTCPNCYNEQKTRVGDPKSTQILHTHTTKFNQTLHYSYSPSSTLHPTHPSQNLSSHHVLRSGCDHRVNTRKQTTPNGHQKKREARSLVLDKKRWFPGSSLIYQISFFTSYSSVSFVFIFSFLQPNTTITTE